MLETNNELTAVKQTAFNHYHKSGKEEFQIQVIVTRCKSDFLEDFVTEETKKC